MNRPISRFGWTLLLAMPLLLLGTDLAPAPSAGVRPEDVPTILARFSHDRHQRVLRKEGLGCPACHQVGGMAAPGTPPDRQALLFLEAPPRACHYCHNPSGDRKARGPRTCATCHDQALKPVSHGAGFLLDHGADARLEGRACYSCHRRQVCVDCHERSDPTRYRAHERTWIAVHGLAVQADPTSCSGCHVQSSCVQCHSSTGDSP